MPAWTKPQRMSSRGWEEAAGAGGGEGELLDELDGAADGSLPGEVLARIL
jgi:hypothetical protein